MAEPDELFDFLRACGLRKKVARSVAGLEGGHPRPDGEGLARSTVGDLRAAADMIRDRVLEPDGDRPVPYRKTPTRETARRISARSRRAMRALADGARLRSRAAKARLRRTAPAR